MDGWIEMGKNESELGRERDVTRAACASHSLTSGRLREHAILALEDEERTMREQREGEAYRKSHNIGVKSSGYPMPPIALAS